MKKRERANANEVERFEPSFESGLTASQVNTRKGQGLVNTSVSSAGKSYRDIVVGNVFTYFNLVFAVFAIFLIIVKSYTNLTFLVVVVLNSLIGIIQEVRAKRVLGKLKFISAPRVTTVRDSQEESVNSNELVLDDVVILSSGDQICADAVVMSGEVQVNESLLTGEADEITKTAGDSLLSGSFVVSGKCRAKLTAVGEDSYISKLTVAAKKSKVKEHSQMTKSLDRIIKTVGIIIVPLAVALVLTRIFILHETFEETVVSSSAALIGMIPQGLYLLASIALAVSAIRLAMNKVLVHEMNCIETLARVDVLCVDKTGTVTGEDMVVSDVVPIDKNAEKDEVFRLLRDFVENMEKDNLTANALKAYFSTDSGERRKATGFVPFTSKTKYSAALFGDECLVLGAPEFVMREKFAEISEVAEKYFSEGYRVTVFGRYAGVADGEPLTEEFEPLALVLMTNPVRENAAETFGYFAEQGVEIKVISGDNPSAVSAVAQRAGIQNADKYINAGELQTDEQIEDAADKYSVFGRTTPEQKRKLINALKANGHTVAMVGDGVNDVLALKDADCSVAMASGSSAAGQVSQLVLLDSDFSHMPSVVYEGRRVVNNIQRSASLFLVKTIFSFLTTLFAVIAMKAYPMIPAQISVISAFTIGIPAFFLAMEPNKNRIKGHFLKTVLSRAIPAGITNFLLAGAIIIASERMGFTHAEMSTAAMIVVGFVGILMIFITAWPINSYRACVIAGSALGLVLSAYFLRSIINLVRIPNECEIMVLILTAVSIPIVLLLKKAVSAVLKQS